MSARFAFGLDFGTNSCRSLLVDLSDGTELGSHVFPYPSGEHGILLDPKDPNVARQNPQDHIDGLEVIIRGALEQAKIKRPDFDPSQVIGIGIDTTGSTPIPVDQDGTPLGLLPQFKVHLNAQIWLWKDHTSHAEAKEITDLAHQFRPNIIAKSGGVYSSEWFWSKILHVHRIDPELAAAAYSWVENCDWLPALLTGNTKPSQIKRSVCAAGHKALFSTEWGGLPDKEFLSQLDPRLAELRDRLYDQAYTTDTKIGGLSASWAQRLGLREGIAICVGAFDAHTGAVGAGIKEGTMVKIMGTSTCDIMVAPNAIPLADIPGVCGIVNGSVTPTHYGIEAGQSAVGDLFLWLVHHLVPDCYGSTSEEKFNHMAKALESTKVGATGLLALDWNNGNRTVLVDQRLTGLVLGQSLHTEAHEIYQAYMEATAFGALTIMNRIEAYGVPIQEVVNTGGLSIRNERLMQIYADVTGRPMKISRSEQTCALGAAIFAAVAAGVGTLEEIQSRTTGYRDKVFYPIPEHHAIYQQLFALYQDLHDAFGSSTWQGNLHHVMKTLLEIRDAQRKA